MPAQNRVCRFSMWTFLKALLAAVFLILTAAVFIFHEGNIDVTTIFSFIGITILLGYPAWSCVVARGFNMRSFLRYLLLFAISLVLEAVFILYSQGNIHVTTIFSFEGIIAIIGLPACCCVAACGFNMWTLLRALLSAAVSFILLDAVFILRSQGNIDMTSIFSIRGIIIIFGLPACFCVAAFIVAVVHLKFLRGGNSTFASDFTRFFMPVHSIRESPVQHDGALQRIHRTRDIASAAPGLLNVGRNRIRRQRRTEDIGLSILYNVLTAHLLHPRRFERSSTAMETITSLMWLDDILDSGLLRRTERRELPRIQSDSILQLNDRTSLQTVLRNELNRIQWQNEDVFSLQRATAEPSGKQQEMVVKSEETHLLRQPRVHRRNLLRRVCTSTTMEQMNSRPWVLSGSPGTRQRSTGWNVDDFPIVFVQSRNESPEIVSEQVQRNESLAIREQDGGVHRPTQVPGIPRIFRRLRQRSSLDEPCKGEQNKKPEKSD